MSPGFPTHARLQHIPLTGQTVYSQLYPDATAHLPSEFHIHTIGVNRVLFIGIRTQTNYLKANKTRSRHKQVQTSLVTMVTVIHMKVT
jgi:hypothetical protein